jgi:uncharacterized membrane protein YsdA (DUF1294 family)
MVRHRHVSPRLIFGLIASILAVSILLALHFRLGVPWLLSYLLGVNFTVFFLYGYDKLAARREKLRVPEIVLHALAFAGGTPFAWFGQRLFRHKTLKSSFRIVFWVVAVIQLILLVWALWQWGLPPLRGG